MKIDGAEGEEKPDYPISGSFLVSGGYDGMVKVWSADDWQQVKSMTSDQSGKVMSVDVSAGELQFSLSPSFLLDARTLSNEVEASGAELISFKSADARFIASAEYSRTFKLWSHPDVDLE